MNEVFEKIIKKLEELKKLYVDLQLSSKNNIEITAYAGKEQAIGIAIEYINEVAKEYVTDTNTGNNGWIPCSERLPEEHDSIFAKLKGTDKWYDAMFEKISDDVNATVEFEDGTRKTMTLHTNDGKWNTNNRIVKFNVIAWQPLPKPFQKGE